MRRFANPSQGITDLVLLLIGLNAGLYWFSKEIDQRPDLAGLDFLLWLAVPCLFIVVYLTFGRLWFSAGLLPVTKGRGQGGWFLLAVFLPMGLAGGLLLLNQLFGLVTLKPDTLADGAMVGLLSLSGFFVKNIVEELIFRGFLTDRFAQTVLAGGQGHLLTGMIWAFWHLTYWTVMLPAGRLAEVSGLPVPAFVLVGFVALSLQSILLGELRLITGSIWAGVILHTLNNALFAGLVAAQAVPLGNLFTALMTPIDIGLIYTALMAGIGLWMWRKRLGGGSAMAQARSL